MTKLYQTKGFNFNDFDLIVKDGELHAVYVKKITYPKNDIDSRKPNRYGLVKSKDGVRWKEIGDIILPEQNGWDQSLWAGSISNQGDGYVIYYTAVLQKERQSSCKIGKAYSKDLIHWEKDTKNPVLVFDSKNPYYSDEPQLAFRDPFYFGYNGKKYLIFCAKDKSKPSKKRGCVGIVEEIKPNTFKWLPPLFSPGKYFDGLECPAIYFINKKWYLLYGLDSENSTIHNMRYAISEDLFGKYNELTDNQLSAEGEYIGRIINFKGKLLYYCSYRDFQNGLTRERLNGPKIIKINKKGKIILYENAN